MQCPACKSDVSASARFCPSCAAPLLKDEDFKSPAEVNVDWLKGILEGQGFSVDAGKQDNTFLARHDTRPNLFVTHRPTVSLLTIETSWRLKKPSWGQKTEFLAAINKGNTIHFLCACYAPDSMDVLNISTALYLTERLSSRDVVAFLEMFFDGISNVIEKSGILKFS